MRGGTAYILAWEILRITFEHAEKRFGSQHGGWQLPSTIGRSAVVGGVEDGKVPQKRTKMESSEIYRTFQKCDYTKKKTRNLRDFRSWWR